MRFTQVFVAGALVAAASAQDTTASSEATPTYAMDPAQSSTLACIDSCDPTDLSCIAHCNPVPDPSDQQAIDTTECVANCDQGDGSEADTNAYAECMANCITENFFHTTAGTPQPSGAPPADNSSSDESGSETTATDGSATDVPSTETTGTNSAAPTNSSSDSEDSPSETEGGDAPDSTESGASNETTSAEDGAATLFTTGTGLFVAIAAIMAL